MTLDEKIQAALDLQTLKLPKQPKVAQIKYRWYEELSATTPATGPDEGAIWLTVLLAAKTPPKYRKWEYLGPIEQAIRDALRKAVPGVFPFIDYLKASELVA